MLVLSRKQSEVILIGDDIRIVVSKLSGGSVTLGIDAPLEVKVLRAEVTRRAEKVSPIITENGKYVVASVREVPISEIGKSSLNLGPTSIEPKVLPGSGN